MRDAAPASNAPAVSPSDDTPTEPFGQHLRELRESRKFTLRDVERITNGRISNAYLSQLESGKIKAPSMAMLHTLSAAYGVDFGALCEKALGEQPQITEPDICPTCGRPSWDRR